MTHPTIGILIPTFNAAKHLPYCLPPLIASPLKPRLLIIDSSSTDETLAIAGTFGVETLVIPQEEFNHGTTREKGRLHLETDIVVMITQDAYCTSPYTLEYLVEPLIKDKASISYAKQIPHNPTNFFEAFPRSFNYPTTSHIRSLKEASLFGVYTFFCSNSCAAYLNCALDEIGGFSPVLFGEDTIAVAKLLYKGHQIAYVAEAEVQHSHSYSLKQEFQRHFDMGLSRRSYENLIHLGGKDTKRGADYVRAMLSKLKKEQPSLIPYALLQTLVKFTGYHLGRYSTTAPIWLKKALSSQSFYWRSKGYLKKRE